jgi:hypothetical protein
LSLEEQEASSFWELEDGSFEELEDLSSVNFLHFRFVVSAAALASLHSFIKLPTRTSSALFISSASFILEEMSIISPLPQAPKMIRPVAKIRNIKYTLYFFI